MRTPSPREQRLVAIAILIALATGAWRLVLSPVIDGYFGRADERRDLAAEYLRNDRVLAGLPGWTEEARIQARTAQAFAITAPSDAIAVELLSQRIARDVKVAGGAAPSTVPVIEKTPRGWVHVRSNLDLTIGALNGVLTRIQNEEPYVVVGYLSIDKTTPSQPDEPQSLAVRLDLFAAIRTQAAPLPPRTPPSRI